MHISGNPLFLLIPPDVFDRALIRSFVFFSENVFLSAVPKCGVMSGWEGTRRLWRVLDFFWRQVQAPFESLSYPAGPFFMARLFP